MDKENKVTAGILGELAAAAPDIEVKREIIKKAYELLIGEELSVKFDVSANAGPSNETKNETKNPK